MIRNIAVLAVLAVIACGSGRQVIVVNRACAEVSSDAKAADFLPKGWKVLETVKSSKLTVADLQFKEVTRDDEFRLTGLELRERSAKMNSDLGLDDAITVLVGQDKLSTELQEYELVFTGTLVLDDRGMQNMPYLRHNGHCWELQWVSFHPTGYLTERVRVPHI